MMKIWALNVAIVASFASALVGSTSCTASCEDKGTCGPYSSTGGSAGSGTASGGTAGAGGKAGASGTGGTTGANSGAGGATAGDAGQAGEGGTSGASSGRGGSSASGGGGGSGESAAGGEAGTAGGVPSCDGALSPDEDECVVTEEYGIFVSPTGDDDLGNGTRSRPYATLAKAIGEATSRDKRVYACADGGSYEESVGIDASASGIGMFGGFSCNDWSYGTSRQSRVTSATPLALRIDGAEGVRIEDFSFEAADATAPGESSVGAFVTESMGVVIRRTTITAGDGRDGADGSLDEFSYQDQAALDGHSESVATMGGGDRVCACQAKMTSVGGAGGPPSTTGQPGTKGLPDHGAGSGGTPPDCGSGGTGVGGASAPVTVPALGASTLGTLNATGWKPASGANGKAGQPGQGGGGGASLTASGHGGGGGCGGCGGNGGKAGQGGGASVALLILESEVIVESSTLIAADAGRGGDGRMGQLAQTERGAGGNVVSLLNSCPGGNGGLGADGAAGGGAAGGLSVGILWKGATEPIQNALEITTGTPGTKGIGGEPGVNDGTDGESAEVLEAS
jgi:hypothetical protein